MPKTIFILAIAVLVNSCGSNGNNEIKIDPSDTITMDHQVQTESIKVNRPPADTIKKNNLYSKTDSTRKAEYLRSFRNKAIKLRP